MVPEPITPRAMPLACSSCNLRQLCMPPGLAQADLDRLDQLVSVRKQVNRGRSLFRHGDRFGALYAVRTGFFKTTAPRGDGVNQVTGFQMAGEILGLDGIASQRHACHAVALEDAIVCVLPYDRITSIAHQVPALQHHLYRTMSRDLVHSLDVMLMLGSMRAEARLAAFLLNLVQRLKLRGFSQTELLLRMARADIGSYLGLTIETVSRTLGKLAAAGIVQVTQRHIVICDAQALGAVAHGLACEAVHLAANQSASHLIQIKPPRQAAP